jgi:2-polyprenyl-3-methyl-5-hydroxy-6-metoxy-1,4-benzoquinol methylase
MRRTSLQSAREVIPLVRHYYDPASVVDVGCGGGSWLSVFHELGIRDIYGLDGDWANTDDLLIPSALFQETDFLKPFRLSRTFDLVVCLEIAEHIQKSSAPVLIESLTHLGPVILFSAAIPDQGGVDHVNEQWPEYWARLFGRFRLCSGRLFEKASME